MTQEYGGVPCSPGLAVAPAWASQAGAPSVPLVATPDQVREAFGAASGYLDQLAVEHRSAGATAYADILEAEALIALDPSFAADVVALLDQRAGDATTAVREVAERHATALEGLESAELRERAADVRAVARLVTDRLAGRPSRTPPSGLFVLVAEEVAAPDLLAHAELLAGVVSVRGGPSSHASIIARSLGVPFVVGVDPEVLEVEDGVALLVDGDSGRVVVAPAAGSYVVTTQPTAAELAAQRELPARTLDGVDVTLLANVASAVEARRSVAAGARGVGLLRTELAHLGATGWPSRAEHERALRPVLAELVGLPVTVRLLDFTHDKTPPFLSGRAGDSLALLLGDPAALAAQLEGLLSVAGEADVRVLVPMVQRAEELRTVRSAIARAAEAVGVDRLPELGAMLESRASIDALPRLCEVGDFFSLGTNDLTADVLGVSRVDLATGPVQAARPEVLRLVGRAVDLTAAAGRPLSLCGDAGADPAVLPMLLGAGLTTLSVAPSRLDAVRAAVRGLDLADCRRRYDDAVRGRSLVTLGGRDA